jgi:hypothetical protein
MTGDDDFDGNHDPATVAFNRVWRKVRIFLMATTLILFGVGSAWGSLLYQVSSVVGVVKLHIASPGHTAVLTTIEGVKTTLGEVERRLNSHLDQSLPEGKEIAALGAAFKIFSVATTDRLIRIENAIEQERRAGSRRIPAALKGATLSKVGR